MSINRQGIMRCKSVVLGSDHLVFKSDSIHAGGSRLILGAGKEKMVIDPCYHTG